MYHRPRYDLIHVHIMATSLATYDMGTTHMYHTTWVILQRGTKKGRQTHLFNLFLQVLSPFHFQWSLRSVRRRAFDGFAKKQLFEPRNINPELELLPDSGNGRRLVASLYFEKGKACWFILLSDLVFHKFKDTKFFMFLFVDSLVFYMLNPASQQHQRVTIMIGWILNISIFWLCMVKSSKQLLWNRYSQMIGLHIPKHLKKDLCNCKYYI